MWQCIYVYITAKENLYYQTIEMIFSILTMKTCVLCKEKASLTQRWKHIRFVFTSVSVLHILIFEGFANVSLLRTHFYVKIWKLVLLRVGLLHSAHFNLTSRGSLNIKFLCFLYWIWEIDEHLFRYISLGQFWSDIIFS